MKLIKISLIQNQNIIGTNFSIIKISGPKSSFLNFTANIIRRSLIKNA